MHTGSRRVPVRQGSPGEEPAAGRGQAVAAELERLAEPVARAAGMDLDSVDVTRAGRRRVLRVVIDATAATDAGGGVGLDDIALVSHELSAKLDASGIMGEAPYTLEVSSPGVDRPLTQPRHWRRAVGRLVIVPLGGPGNPDPSSPRHAAGLAGHAEGLAGHAEGRVIVAGESGVTLEIDGEHREFSYAEL